MHVCGSQPFVLEHYLRLTTEKPENWLSSLQILTGSPRLSQELHLSPGQPGFYAQLSFLPSRHINLCGIHVHAGLKLFGSNAPAMAIIMPVQGTIEFQVAGQGFLSAPGVPFVLEPDVEFSASLSPDTHLLMVQASRALCAGAERAFDNGDPYLVKILKAYLAETLFFKCHHHAMTRTRCLEEALTLYREGGASAFPADEVKELVIEDRRLGKALQLINERLEEGVQLESIARDSGLSLRNLYYLMNKFTGFTPSSYCRSRRLIKARGSLIRDYPEVPQVASHALKWGFNHVGRFASYYHDHFGEYPSDTIKGLESLSKHSKHVLSVEQGLARQQRAWYTSAISDLVG